MNAPSPDEIEALELGEGIEPFEIDTAEASARCTRVMVTQARHSVEIVSRALDPSIYGRAEVCDALKAAVLERRRLRVRVLVRDPGPAVRQGHPLVDLARRLSTFFEIRVPAAQHAEYNAAFLMVDRTGVLHRTLADRYEGIVEFAGARTAANLGPLFEEMWAAGEPHPDLRLQSL